MMERLPSKREYDLLNFKRKQDIVNLVQEILYVYLSTEGGNNDRR